MNDALVNGLFVILGAAIAGGVSLFLARQQASLDRGREALALRLSLTSEIERLVVTALQAAIRVENAVRATTSAADPDRAREYAEGAAWLAGEPELNRARLLVARLGDSTLVPLLERAVNARDTWAAEITNWANPIPDRGWDDINVLSAAVESVQEAVGQRLNSWGLAAQ